ncbi:hypothetical protein Taro_050229 [Colocasia esculenta]|uniref:Uncharacterized protein n=1 Tax=Colocasia esculenta TaxID=4460 RepID=A0A843XD96_COLES|nr:hypothetical protein [Colocasia esculenta]
MWFSWGGRGCSVWALGYGRDGVASRDQVATYRCVVFSLNAPRHPSRLANAMGYVVSVQEFRVSLERDGHRRHDEIATRTGSRAAFVFPCRTGRTCSATLVSSPGARHLRACPGDRLLPLPGIPSPGRLLEGVLRASGVLKSQTWSRRGKWWGQWRGVVCRALLAGLVLRGRVGVGPQLGRAVVVGCVVLCCGSLASLYLGSGFRSTGSLGVSRVDTDYCFYNPFLGAIRGGTGVCSFLDLMACPRSKVVLLMGPQPCGGLRWPCLWCVPWVASALCLTMLVLLESCQARPWLWVMALLCSAAL